MEKTKSPRVTSHPNPALPVVRICEACGSGTLEFVDERPHPMLGIVGKSLSIFRCTATNCGACQTEAS